jgi:hypothetical protein
MSDMIQVIVFVVVLVAVVWLFIRQGKKISQQK